MREYEAIRDVVLKAGGLLQEEHVTADHFGSAYAVFGRDGSRFRVVWDGKEEYGLIQTETENSGWKDRHPIVRKRFGGNLSEIEEFTTLAKQLVASNL